MSAGGAHRSVLSTAGRNGGVSQRNEYGSIVCVLPVALAGLSPYRRRWHCVRRQSSPRSLRLQQGLTTPQRHTARWSGTTTPLCSMVTSATLRVIIAGITHRVIIAIIGIYVRVSHRACGCDIEWGSARLPAPVSPLRLAPARQHIGGFSSSNVVAEARRYIGGNPTGRGSLWCARFMNMVLQHTGHRGTGSDMARSFASYGHACLRSAGRRHRRHGPARRRRPCRHRQRHRRAGNPIMVSGNNGNRVREAPVSRGRIYAYVMPN